jgi:methyl-accepting chemotaxis protein
MSFNVSEIAKIVLQNNSKIFESVSNMSAMSEEAFASALSFQDMVSKQEDIFLNIKGASEHLDELSAALSVEVFKFKIN